MPCDSQAQATPELKRAQETAVERLGKALAVGGGVSVVIGATGALAFRGWADKDRAGLSDLCAYRKLAAKNSPELRLAVARAQALYGRKLDLNQVAAGSHSHDGGQTWHGGH